MDYKTEFYQRKQPLSHIFHPDVVLFADDDFADWQLQHIVPTTLIICAKDLDAVYARLLNAVQQYDFTLHNDSYDVLQIVHIVDGLLQPVAINYSGGGMSLYDKVDFSRVAHLYSDCPLYVLISNL